MAARPPSGGLFVPRFEFINLIAHNKQMPTEIAFIIFIILFSWIVPSIVAKYKIKDDIKHAGTLPMGTAQFKGFLKLVKFVLLGFLFLWLIASALQLLGVEF